MRLASSSLVTLVICISIIKIIRCLFLNVWQPTLQQIQLCFCTEQIMTVLWSLTCAAVILSLLQENNLSNSLPHRVKCRTVKHFSKSLEQWCVQNFLLVGHITNFRHLAGPHEKFSFLTWNIGLGFSWTMGKNQSVGKGHTKWPGGPGCGPRAACCPPLLWKLEKC